MIFLLKNFLAPQLICLIMKNKLYFLQAEEQGLVTYYTAVLEMYAVESTVYLNSEPVSWDFMRHLMHSASSGKDSVEFQRMVENGNYVKYFRVKGELKSESQMKAYVKRNKQNKTDRVKEKSKSN